jgi:acyl carrier protein
LDWQGFVDILARFVKGKTISGDDILFGEGIDIGSVSFVEFIMTLEEEYGLDIDLDGLDGGIKTVRQLYDRLSAP